MIMITIMIASSIIVIRYVIVILTVIIVFESNRKQKIKMKTITQIISMII